LRPRGFLVALLLFLSTHLAPRPVAAAGPLEKLAQVLRTARDYKRRLAAVIGLARLGDRKALPAGISALTDPESTVRGAAAGALGKLGDDGARPALEALLQREKDAFVLRSAQSALAALLRGPEVARPRDPDDIQVDGTTGTLDEQEARDGVTARLPQITTCYMRERASAPFLAGRVDLKFRISTTGQARWVRLVRSDLGSIAVERCILAEMARARFPAPEGGEAEFSIPLSLHPQTIDVSSGPQPPSRVAPEAKRLVKACKNLSLPPGLLVTMYVDDEGAVLSVGLSASSGEIAADLAGELSSRLRAVKLPARGDGHTVKVVTRLPCPSR
jgi:hypothetical protein